MEVTIVQDIMTKKLYGVPIGYLIEITKEMVEKVIKDKEEEKIKTMDSINNIKYPIICNGRVFLSETESRPLENLDELNKYPTVELPMFILQKENTQ